MCFAAAHVYTVLSTNALSGMKNEHAQMEWGEHVIREQSWYYKNICYIFPPQNSHILSIHAFFSAQSCPICTNIDLCRGIGETFTSLNTLQQHEQVTQKATLLQINTQTDLILCSLERSGLRLLNFWASLQTVTMKKKTLRMMMKHTGP